MESRLDQLYRLKKKYGATVEEMLDYLDRCRRELDDIQDAGDTLAASGKAAEARRKRPPGRRRRACPRPGIRRPQAAGGADPHRAATAGHAAEFGLPIRFSRSRPWTATAWTRCGS